MTLPRKIAPKPATRTRNLLTQLGGGLTAGYMRSASPVRRPQPSNTGIPSYAIVDHLDDPDLTRPVALVVLWRGAAVPVNSQKSDQWYPSNDF